MLKVPRGWKDGSAVAALLKDPVSTASLHGSLRPSVTSVSGDLMLFPGDSRHASDAQINMQAKYTLVINK